jgi:hypothetical protein
MKRLPFLLLLVLSCGQWGAHTVPLQFTTKSFTGEAAVERPDANGIPVTIHLRLGHPEAFGNDFNLSPMVGFPCQEIRLLYRRTPQSAPRFLQTEWADHSVMWSEHPQVCLNVGIEAVWRVSIARERGELPLDVDGRLVLITHEEQTSAEEISVVVIRIRRSSEDFDKESREGIDAFVVARSQWLPLVR